MSTNRNGLRSRIRGWFNRLTRVQKLLTAIAGLVITIGAVASAITAVLDLGERLSDDGSGETGGPKAYLGVEVRDFIPQVVEGGGPVRSPPPQDPGIEVPPYGVRVIAADRNSPA